MNFTSLSLQLKCSATWDNRELTLCSPLSTGIWESWFPHGSARGKDGRCWEINNKQVTDSHVPLGPLSFSRQLSLISLLTSRTSVHFFILALLWSSLLALVLYALTPPLRQLCTLQPVKILTPTRLVFRMQV